MLRSGLILLVTSVISITLRSYELISFSEPTFKLICSLTLIGSIACFLGTYYVSSYAQSKSSARK